VKGYNNHLASLIMRTSQPTPQILYTIKHCCQLNAPFLPLRSFRSDDRAMDVNKPKVRDLSSVQVLVNGQKRVTLNTVKSSRCSNDDHLDFLLSEFQRKVLAVENSERFNVASDALATKR
jgi:hypothetical protein